MHSLQFIHTSIYTTGFYTVKSLVNEHPKKEFSAQHFFFRSHPFTIYPYTIMIHFNKYYLMKLSVNAIKNTSCLQKYNQYNKIRTQKKCQYDAKYRKSATSCMRAETRKRNVLWRTVNVCWFQRTTWKYTWSWPRCFVVEIPWIKLWDKNPFSNSTATQDHQPGNTFHIATAKEHHYGVFILADRMALTAWLKRQITRMNQRAFQLDGIRKGAFMLVNLVERCHISKHLIRKCFVSNEVDRLLLCWVNSYGVTTVIRMVYVMHTTWTLWINAVCSNVPTPYTCSSYLTTNTFPCYLHIATSKSGAKSCYKSALQVMASTANVDQHFSGSWCKHKNSGGPSDVQWWLENIKCCHNCVLFNKANAKLKVNVTIW